MYSLDDFTFYISFFIFHDFWIQIALENNWKNNFPYLGLYAKTKPSCQFLQHNDFIIFKILWSRNVPLVTEHPFERSFQNLKIPSMNTMKNLKIKKYDI